MTTRATTTGVSAIARRLRYVASSSQSVPSSFASTTPISSRSPPSSRHVPSCLLQQLRHNAGSPSKSNKDDGPGGGGSDSGAKKATTPKDAQEPTGFLDRLLRPDASGESPVLRMLGYYSAESKAIGAANSLYSQILTRASSTVKAEFPMSSSSSSSSASPESSPPPTATAATDAPMTAAEFLPKYEMMALHIYLTLRRLRQESGSSFEADVKVTMQTLFDKFWTDVRYRLMIEEHNLTLLQSGKWVKQCEKNFFSMALAFDESWDAPREKLSECIANHITSLKKDPARVSRFLHYMIRERHRLDKISIEELWQGGICWGPQYSPVMS